MKSVNSGVAGSVRLHQLTRASITIAEKHGKRLDATGKARAINKEPALTRTGLNLNDLYDAHVEGDVFIPKAKTKAMHMILQFPKELVDPNDAAGMLDHARAYAERVFGPDAVFADRIDRDERNKQVVDLFIAPKYLKPNKVAKVAVSMTRHLKLLAEKHGHKPHPMGIGRAMQDELFEYFRDVMKLDGVERGATKVFAGDDWKSAEQQRLEELEEQERLLKERAAELDARDAEIKAKEEKIASELAEREANVASREGECVAAEAALRQRIVSAEIEAAQAKLLFRATDDGEGLALTILETGKPKMNEAAMDESERLAYRSTWSERMLELARFVAQTLQAVRKRVVAAMKRESAAVDREAATVAAEEAAQERLSAASAMEKKVAGAKAVAEAFLTAWSGISEEERSPPVREAIIKADTLLAPEKQPRADPVGTGDPKSRAAGVAALRALGRGPKDREAHTPGGIPRARDGTGR